MGQVVDADAVPVVGAHVALVYLDISRMLLSADGRSEPLTTDEDGAIPYRPCLRGSCRVRGDGPGCGPEQHRSNSPWSMAESTEDIILTTSEGATVRGTVVDDQKRPVAGAAVELRPFERPDDPRFIKMMLKIRRVEAVTGADGTFVAKGLTGQRVRIKGQQGRLHHRDQVRRQARRPRHRRRGAARCCDSRQGSGRWRTRDPVPGRHPHARDSEGR